MPNENINPDKTRQERRWIYQDGVHTVIGHTKVRYEPNVKRDVYGSAEVFIDFPGKRDSKITFALSLYPTALDKNEDPSCHIVSVPDGILNMFIESNKLCASMIRNATGVRGKEFSYKNIGIFAASEDEDEEVFLPDGSVMKRYLRNGTILHKTKDVPFVRRGDQVMMAQCVELIDQKTGKSTFVWECEYNPRNNEFSLFDKLVRRPFAKLFRRNFYKQRYVNKTSFALRVSDVKYTDIKPIEEQTIISDRKED